MKKKLLTLFVILAASSFGLESKALVHYTDCTTRPGHNRGLCTAKALAGHGNECIIGGNCLTSPSWWQQIWGVVECNCYDTEATGE